MKRKSLFFLESILVGAALLFSACDAAPDNDQTASAAGGPPLSAPQAAGGPNTGSGTDVSGGENLRLVTSDENLSARKTTGNENGYYYVDRSDGVNANLRYIDYATAQDIYLSSRPEANHLTPEDDSYISSVAGLGIAFPVGDSLFLLRAGAPDYADRLGQDALAAVFRMELDGTGRRQLYLGAGDEVLFSTAAADDAYLYLISQRVEEDAETPALGAYLIRVDQRTGETKELCRLSSNTFFTAGVFLIGAGDGLLVFHNVIDTRQEDTVSRTHEILAYDVASGTLSTIETWPQDLGTAVVVYDGMLIMASPHSRTVRVRALRAEEAAAEYPLPDSLPADFGHFRYASCRDGHFLFWDHSAQTMHALDLATGEWSGVTLRYTDPVKDDPRPVEILSETATHFLVCRGQKSVTRRFFDPDDGIPYETERIQPVFALIPKEDYWADVPNYRDIHFND